jgi:Glycerophosphoryl diester phosphodiesterase family
MKLRLTACAIVVLVLFNLPLTSHGQESPTVCPAANPAQRPSGITPSKWNLTKVLQYLKAPTPQVPGSGLVVLISHRGNWEFCPENTLEAFQSAWDLGVEGAEMDVRVSAPGVDPKTGVSYPNGEVFLSHDWDIRGEAPSTDFTMPTKNTIYGLTPDQLSSRTMVDRHGKYLVDSSGNSLYLPSFTDLLNSLYQRATSLGLVSAPSPRKPEWKYLGKGMLLVVDVKGLNQNPLWTEYAALIEAAKEMYAFETANQIDLGDAIAFKIQFKDFEEYSAASLLNAVTNPDIGYPAGAQIPPIIFIVFPQDACKPESTNAEPCKLIPPAENTALNDYLTNYPAFLLNDWQHRNEGDALTTYLTDPLWINRGVASFLASNNFAEGLRNSGGNCLNTFSDSNIIGPKPNPDLPPINTSYCISDPMQRWSSAALDYLVPSFGPRHATSITTDLYQNASDYLTAIGLNNTSLLLP